MGVATGSPLEYVSRPSVVERIIVKERTKDIYPAIPNVALVSTTTKACHSAVNIITLQSQLTGEIGKTGPNAVRNAEEAFHIEEGDATNPSVHILII